MQHHDLLKGASLRKLLAKGAIGALLVQGVGALLVLLADVFLARLLGVSQFGLYSEVMAWMFMFVLFGTLGFNHALLRYVPTYIAHHAWADLRGILKRSSTWTALASLAMVIVIMLSLGVFRSSDAIFVAVAIALVGLPFQVLAGLRQATLRGLHQTVRALTPELIIRPAALLMLLGVVAAFWESFGAAQAIFLNLVAVLLAFMVGVVWQRRYLPGEVAGAEAVYHDREWFAVAWPLLVLVCLQALESSRTDIMLLGLLVNEKAAGIYAAANRLAEIILMIIASANAVAASLMARLHATGERQELQQLVSMATAGVLLAALPISVLLVIFGHDILRLFGTEFVSGYLPLTILLAAQLVVAMAGSVMLLLTLTGHQSEAAIHMAWGVVLKLILSLVLIPNYGMMGAAVATFCGALLWNIRMLQLVRRTVGVDPSVIQVLRMLWHPKSVAGAGSE